MIKPTIGRVVWFTESRQVRKANGGQPFAAIIAFVHSDSLVNLAVFDANGNSVPRPGIYLAQAEDIEVPPDCYCEWMPYQQGQAAKTESLEKKLVQATGFGETRGQVGTAASLDKQLVDAAPIETGATDASQVAARTDIPVAAPAEGTAVDEVTQKSSAYDSGLDCARISRPGIGDRN